MKAHSYPLGDKCREQIASQIGEPIWVLVHQWARQHQVKEPEEIALGEAFEVWLLELNELETPEARYGALPRRINEFYHQIRFDGSAVAEARTSSGKDGNWIVREVALSRLPQRVDKGLAFIEHFDSNVKSDPLVRLLEVPDLRVAALWLSQAQGLDRTADEFVIIDAPDRSRLEPLEEDVPLDWEGLIDRLSTQPHVEGIRFSAATQETR